jgi:hypothetical protein
MVRGGRRGREGGGGGRRRKEEGVPKLRRDKYGKYETIRQGKRAKASDFPVVFIGVQTPPSSRVYYSTGRASGCPIQYCTIY